MILSDLRIDGCFLDHQNSPNKIDLSARYLCQKIQGRNFFCVFQNKDDHDVCATKEEKKNQN